MSNQCGCNHWTKPVCPEASCPWNEWKAQQNIAASKVQRRPWAPGGPNNELPTAYYTSPPAQRKPLTDDELDKCLREAKLSIAPAVSFRIGFRAAEAAHGIKENT